MGVVLHRRSVETDEGLETPSGGSQSFVVVTNVPLPNHVRRVVGKSQVLGQQAILCGETPLTVVFHRVHVHTRVKRVNAREKCRPRWGAVSKTLARGWGWWGRGWGGG